MRLVGQEGFVEEADRGGTDRCGFDGGQGKGQRVFFKDSLIIHRTIGL